LLESVAFRGATPGAGHRVPNPSAAPQSPCCPRPSRDEPPTMGKAEAQPGRASHIVGTPLPGPAHRIHHPGTPAIRPTPPTRVGDPDGHSRDNSTTAKPRDAPPSGRERG